MTTRRQFLSQHLRNVAAVSCIATLAWSQSAFAQVMVIKGGGATSFPGTFYANWAQSNPILKDKLNLTYEGTGAGLGLGMLEKRQVDFASVDSPVSKADLAKKGWVQFPLYMGAVVPVVNLRGVKDVRMTSDLLAKIFNGDITNWNDPAIRALNPGLTSVGPIKPVSRGNIAGTAEVFINYLLKSSDLWSKTYADNNTWKPVVTVKPVLEMVSYFNATPGAISFAPFAVAVRENLTMVSLKNKSGVFVAPSPSTFTAASQVSHFGDLPGDYVDLPGNDTWPIASAGWLVMEKQPKDPERARAVLRFFFAALSESAMPTNTGLIALPDRAKTKAVGRFKEVTTPAGRPIDFMS